MPALFNIAANLVLGAALPLAVRRSPALHDAFLSWQLLFLAAFEAVVITPVATYLFRFHPQWSMLYAFDPQLYPNFEAWVGPLSAAVVVLNFAALGIGFSLARRGILTGKTWLWASPLAVGFAVFAGGLGLFGARVAFIGDFDAFWQGQGTLFLRRVAGWAGIAMYAASAAFVVWARARFGRRDPHLI